MIENKIIVIVDDHGITRKGIVEVLLDTIKDIEIVEFNDEESAINFIQKNNKIHLIISDLQLYFNQKSFNIPQLAKKLNLPHIIHTSFENKVFIEEAIKNNAMGYICKRSETIHLIQGVTKALNGEKYTCPIASASLDRDNLNWEPIKLKLSPTEKEIMQLYVNGMNTESILKTLKISNSTLHTHRRNIFSKNQCNFEQAIESFHLWHGVKANIKK